MSAKPIPTAGSSCERVKRPPKIFGADTSTSQRRSTRVQRDAVDRRGVIDQGEEHSVEQQARSSRGEGRVAARKLERASRKQRIVDRRIASAARQCDALASEVIPRRPKMPPPIGRRPRTRATSLRRAHDSRDKAKGISHRARTSLSSQKAILRDPPLAAATRWPILGGWSLLTSDIRHPGAQRLFGR